MYNPQQRDLLEDFLNDVPTTNSRPTTTGISALGSSNVGGMGRGGPVQPSYAAPYGGAGGSTNLFAQPPPAPAPAPMSSPDPFDDDAFNFRSTPYSPPNPATNPFYLGNDNKRLAPAPPAPASSVPNHSPATLSSINNLMSNNLGNLGSSNGTLGSTEKKNNSNKYGSSYGSRTNAGGPAPNSPASNGLSSSLAFSSPPPPSPLASPPQQPTYSPAGYPPQQQQQQPRGPQTSQQFAPPPQQQQPQYRPQQPPPQNYGQPLSQSGPQFFPVQSQAPQPGYPQQQPQYTQQPPHPGYGAPQQYGAPPPQQRGPGPAPQQPIAPWADEDDPFSSPTPVPSAPVPSSWHPGQSQQYGNMANSGVAQGPPAPPQATSLSNAPVPASSAKKGESSITGFFKGLFSDAPTPQVRKPKGRMPLSVTFAQFQVSTNQIQALFNTWVQDRWFAPVGFMQKVHVGPAERELVPFWQFNTTTMTTTHGKCCYVTHEKTETGTVKAVETWQDGKAVHNNSFKDILLPAWDFDDERKDLLLELKDWDTSMVKQNCQAIQIPTNIRPHPAIEWTDVWPQHTENVIKKQEVAQGKKELLTQTRCTRVRELKSIVTYTSLAKRLIYFPVYTLVYTYEEKNYRVYIHGQTGQVAGARPYGFGALGESAKSGLDSFTDFISEKMKK